VTVYLSTEDLLFIAERVLDHVPEVRDLGLLSSSAARPATLAFGFEPYPDLWTKAAASLQSLAGNHALVDGNKRLAWTAARVFLELNGVAIVAVDVDAAEALVIQVVTHQLDEVPAIAAVLQALYKSAKSRPLVCS
jgi:death-on-curing protein